MPLHSLMLKNNARLQNCLVSDPAHVLRGDRGEHVLLIQHALALLDNAVIAPEELSKALYGPSTAKAVLSYKQKRQIINRAYQRTADDIVGKMTIKALDDELLKRQTKHFSMLLSFGVTAPPQPRMAIVSEGQAHFTVWADQVLRAHGAGNVTIVPVPRRPAPRVAVEAIKRGLAITNAGMLVLSVGHGACFPQYQDEGLVDFAPDAAMRVCGRNYKDGTSDFVNVFYDEKPNDPGLKPLSQKEKDERDQKTNPAAKRRLENWATYQDMCRAFQGQTSALVLLTCKVGGATGFLRRLATHLMTPIIAYKDQVMADPNKPNNRVRVLLAGDKSAPEGVRTNNTFGEIFIPLSPSQMVQISPMQNQEWF